MRNLTRMKVGAGGGGLIVLMIHVHVLQQIQDLVFLFHFSGLEQNI